MKNSQPQNNLIKKLKTNIVLLGLVSFLNDLSSEMIRPILPLLITSLGGTGILIGLVGGFRNSISNILNVFCGYWSDKTDKRRVFVFWGYSVALFFKLCLAFSKLLEHVLIFAGLERIGKGVRTSPRDAIIAESMPHHRGRGFGIHRALDTLGAVIGSILVFFLFWFFGLKFQTIILIAAIIGFLPFIPLLFVKEISTPPKSHPVSFALGIKNLSHSVKLFIFIASIFALANFSYMFFMLKAQHVFSNKLAIGGPIFLYILFNLTYAIFAMPCGLLADKIGKKKIIVSGYILFSLVLLGFAFANTRLEFVVLFLLYGIVYAILEGNQRAFIADLSDQSQDNFKATALGTFHTVFGISSLIASIIAGVLWQFFTTSSVFIYGAIFSILAAILLMLFTNSFGVKKLSAHE